MTKRAPKHPLRNLNILAVTVTLLAALLWILCNIALADSSILIATETTLLVAGVYLVVTLVATTFIHRDDRRKLVQATPVVTSES